MSFTRNGGGGGDMLNIITRDSETDANLNWQIEKDTFRICEKLFSEEQFYFGEFLSIFLS